MMTAWYTVVERWGWQPESIDGLDLSDLYDHADIAKAMFDREREAQAQSQQPNQTSSSGRRLVAGSSFA